MWVGNVHGGRDGLAENAGLGHVVFAFNGDVFEIGPVWALVSETVAEIDKFQPHIVVGVGLEIDAADGDGHVALLLRPKTFYESSDVKLVGNYSQNDHDTIWLYCIAVKYAA